MYITFRMSVEFVVFHLLEHCGQLTSKIRGRTKYVLAVTVVAKGEAGIEDIGSGEILPMTRGLSVIIPSEISSYRIRGNAMFYMASVPF